MYTLIIREGCFSNPSLGKRILNLQYIQYINTIKLTNWNMSKTGKKATVKHLY